MDTVKEFQMISEITKIIYKNIDHATCKVCVSYENMVNCEKCSIANSYWRLSPYYANKVAQEIVNKITVLYGEIV